jgi:hypothetical protein
MSSGVDIFTPGDTIESGLDIEHYNIELDLEDINRNLRFDERSKEDPSRFRRSHCVQATCRSKPYFTAVYNPYTWCQKRLAREFDELIRPP